MGEPVLVGLLFADRVITENNGKKGIVGTFNRFLAPAFPVVFPPWFIYAAVTNINGKHAFSLTLAHEPTNATLFSLGGEIDCPDETNVIELEAPILNVSFAQAGVYSLVFQLDDFPIGSRALRVDQFRPPEKGK
jgi:hypothetical protein